MVARYLLLCGIAVAMATQAPWMNINDTPQQRAQKLLQAMNLTEKLNMLHGWGGGYTGNVPANDRLSIPALNLNDGPQGFRGDPGTSTCWPSGMTAAASWDPSIMSMFGNGMGAEFWAKGANVQLGPGMNVARVPRNGRNFEYLSGEDPTLGYVLVQPVIRGIQANHVIANVKHYINNNQETNRGSATMNVDERTEFEIYLPPWKGAIEAGVGSLMCSYNKINSIYSCENNVTLNYYMKDKLGFAGWAMSDWGATHSTSINQGLDQEMPGGDWMGAKLAAAVAAGTVTQAKIDDSVLRMLTPMFTVGLFDTPNKGDRSANVTSDAHNQLARTISAASTVLVKNSNNVLPLAKDIKNIAIIGSAGSSNPTVHGGGSGQVPPPYVISTLGGIENALGLGPSKPAPYKCDPSTFLNATDFYQPGNPSSPAKDVMDCCNQCGQRSDCNVFSYVASDQTCWFKTTTDGKKDSPSVVSGICRTPAPPGPPSKRCNSAGQCIVVAGDDPTDAVAAAKAADVAIVVLATTSSEGSDRSSLSLPNDSLVNVVAAANPNTVVVISTPGAILMPWAPNASAILINWMPGQEAGNALADVLFGDVNPSARLHLTMPNIENEQNMTESQYPGLNNGENATYSEKLEIGYRWYTAHGVKPNFAFGHGLSYTSFDYSNLQISGRDVSFTVKNTGSRDGAEVTQMYIGFPSSAGEPPLQLRNFSKIMLKAGEQQTVSFSLSDENLSIWDVATHAWSLVKGSFGIFVGGASDNTPLKGSMQV